MPVGRADLHIHTRCSDGLASVEQTLDHVARVRSLDVIAITDHEDVTGGLQAREIAARRNLPFEVVPGAEVTTLQGHLLALFIERCPKSFRSIEATLEAIHAQGGIAIVPHPLSWYTRSLSTKTMDRICRRNEPGITFDAVETGNPSPAGKATARRVIARNRALWRLPQTGSSDAHHLLHIGAGWTEFPGTTSEELRAAILAGEVTAHSGRYASLAEVGYHRIALGLAWGYLATPRKMLRVPLRRPAA